MIALTLSHANCSQASDGDDWWTSLDTGLLIPVEDVVDLIPPLSHRGTDKEDPEVGTAADRSRPALIYVSVVPRRGLSFRFIEVRYRRHLRGTRSPEVLEGIYQQIQSLRKRWDDWYSSEDARPSFRAVRRAKLARVLRFYADKAYRHYLAKDRYESFVTEINRMVEKGGEYSFAVTDKVDRGWVFCPEYAGTVPLEISPTNWETRVILFGPCLLPDSDFRRETPSNSGEYERPSAAATQEPYSGTSTVTTPQPVSSQTESLNDFANQGTAGESITQSVSSP